MCRWAPSGEPVLPTSAPAALTATITTWLCFSQATRASASVIAGSWGKVSPARNTGSSSCHTAGQSVGSKGRICSWEATSAGAGALSIILADPMKPP